MKFIKKRGMIDVSELQKQGKIRDVSNDIDIPTNKDGFVEVSNFNVKENIVKKENIDNKYDLRIQELDKLIYRLEQRVELLEKKLGINNGTLPSINW